jgi:hypothetical protein
MTSNTLLNILRHRKHAQKSYIDTYRQFNVGVEALNGNFQEPVLAVDIFTL